VVGEAPEKRLRRSCLDLAKSSFALCFGINLQIFIEPDASVSTISVPGERYFLPCMVVRKQQDALRYQLFSKCATGSKLNLSKLPPTQDAATYHVFRTSHQVHT